MRSPITPSVDDGDTSGVPDLLTNATQPNPFTGFGGLGSHGGEFYDVRITNRGLPLASSKSIPIFGNPPASASSYDYRKYYHGPEFEEGKRGGYAGNRF